MFIKKLQKSKESNWGEEKITLNSKMKAMSRQVRKLNIIGRTIQLMVSQDKTDG